MTLRQSDIVKLGQINATACFTYDIYSKIILFRTKRTVKINVLNHCMLHAEAYFFLGPACRPLPFKDPDSLELLPIVSLKRNKIIFVDVWIIIMASGGNMSNMFS